MRFRYRLLLPPALIAVAIIIVVVLSNLRPSPDRTGPERLPPLVEYQYVEVAEHQFSVPGQGNVEPLHDTQIVTEVGGQITWVSPRFVAGGFFAEGEMLLQIDPFDYETALEEAKANVARAEAAVAEERARGQVAEAEWAAIEEGEAPDLGLRRPQLASELAGLQSAEASLRKAERDLERTKIRAPFAGVLQSREVSLGQFVTAGNPIGRLYGTGRAEIRVPLTDLDLALLQVPATMSEDDPRPEVTLQATSGGQSREWQGRLVRTEGVIDTSTRVVFGVVAVADPYNREQDSPSHEVPLTFGRFVRVAIAGVTIPDLVELPRYALDPQQRVWVIVENDAGEQVIEPREVDIFRRHRDNIFISSGLADGDRVMLTQLDNPIAGTRVRTPADLEETEAADEVDDNDSADNVEQASAAEAQAGGQD